MVMEKHERNHVKEDVDNSFKDAEKIDLRNEIQDTYGKQEPWFSWVFQIFDAAPGCRVLELGCGTGSLWDENLAQIPRGWEIMLTDRSTAMLHSARKNLGQPRRDKKAQRKLHYLGADSEHLPFPNEHFDLVIAVGVLDLVADLPLALEEIWRVLKVSGQFITTAGGKGHLKELEELVRPFLPEEAQQIGGDESRFGLENGEQWLERCFEQIDRHDYRDQMVFTEPQPVLDYVLSEQIVVGAMSLDQLSSFVGRVKSRLARSGKIKVTIRKGAFSARKTANRLADCAV